MTESSAMQQGPACLVARSLCPAVSRCQPNAALQQCASLRERRTTITRDLAPHLPPNLMLAKLVHVPHVCSLGAPRWTSKSEPWRLYPKIGPHTLQRSLGTELTLLSNTTALPGPHVACCGVLTRESVTWAWPCRPGLRDLQAGSWPGLLHAWFSGSRQHVVLPCMQDLRHDQQLCNYSGQPCDLDGTGCQALKHDERR